MKFKAVLCSILLLTSTTLYAQPVELDKVSVIVDQGVVLESEIQDLVASVKRSAVTSGQELPSDAALRTQATERLILTNLQMQMAERMGIQISDPQLEQTIANIARGEGMTMEELREKLAAEGMSYDNYREEVRKELITGEVRRANVRRRIYITPQEVESLVRLMEQQGLQQAEYHLGHILIGFPPEPGPEEIESARERADKVLELLNNGSDFAKIAIASSSGPKALEGGDMGWLNINAMPTLFAEVVQDRKKDELIGPIRSGAGFHILKIKDLRGVQTVEITEVNARHILIKPSVILSEDKAEQMLKDFRSKVLAGEADFAELAKEHSADPGSALKGGELGWADPSVYVPEFRDTLNQLQPQEISQPFRTTHGWHLAQLLDRRVGDVTDKVQEDKAYQLLFNRKFAEEADNWIREMRDSAYIEVLE
ncbi:peptidylprolyl isomerase SurA [Bowmanella dokdonensis]|uniref:Chaperone SurA n=1 Tax=Bowmanella dokdonensis TaxID=751969 RepID=A0A939IRD1_9ALTE|nr:peptidylprolyl isomerase SurA [Bowmanella dokdonensis]MBN7825527.1 peptidylprolyl isomerase SurA [Bowmanella dokdonensis]